MKTINILTAIVAMVLISACCDKPEQDKSTPPNVVAAFHADYPYAENEEWKKNCSGDYDVWFYNDDKSKEASYDAAGKQIKYGNELEASLLPQDILEYITNEYAGYDIKEVTEHWKDNEHYFVIMLYSNDYAAKLIFDDNSKLLDKYKWDLKTEKEKLHHDKYYNKDCDDDKDKQHPKKHKKPKKGLK